MKILGKDLQVGDVVSGIWLNDGLHLWDKPYTIHQKINENQFILRHLHNYTRPWRPLSSANYEKINVDNYNPVLEKIKYLDDRYKNRKGLKHEN